jgi:alpha-ribazole phosphatase
MIKIVLIRHFATAGNLRKRYIGITDEPILSKVYDKAEYCYPEVECVYSSPLLRCKQTAQTIYPSLEPIEEQLLSECNFGDFENKNYLELRSNPDYQKWVDSGGTLPFPNGEDSLEFNTRSVRGFRQVVEYSIKEKHKTIAIVAHGGTIMSIMDHFSPTQGFYHWQVDNGKGYLLELEETEWKLMNICHTH